MSTIGPCSRGKVLSAKPKNIFFLIRNLMELNFYLQIEANLDQIGAKDKASGHHKSSDELCYHHLKEGGKNY
jgi:hypothetical protein